MVRMARTALGRGQWLAAAALVVLTGLAAWIPLAGGQPVEPVYLVVWWGLAALTLCSAAGLLRAKRWAKPLLGISTGIWLILSGMTLIGVTLAMGVPRAASTAATIGWGAAAAFAAAAIALWFGMRSARAS